MLTKLNMLFCLMIIGSGVSMGDIVSVTVPANEMECRLIRAVQGNIVTAEGVLSIQQIGSPALPLVPLKIALPTGCRAVSMELVSVSFRSAGHVEQIIPVSRQVPTSGEFPFVPADPNREVYNLNAFYPAAPAVFTGSGVLWGIPIATVNLHPARWNPVSHELEFLESLTLNIETDFNIDVSTVSRRTQESEMRSIELLRHLVINSEGVSGSGAAIVESKDLEYGQYVIICPPDYEDEFQILADWKTSKGIPSAVYTTDWIESNYSCYDLPGKIRGFLTDCRNEGTDYCLLGGDDDVLEARRVLLSSLQINRPSDLYFVDINDAVAGSDNWDANNNHIWGEQNDQVEWHPDIWTGRASVNSDAEAELFVNKVLFYEHVLVNWGSTAPSRAPVEMRIGYSTGAMDMGATDTLWGSDDAELVSALVPASWQEEKRYQSEGNNSTPITIEMINTGMNQLFHSSHGGYYGMYTAYGDLMDTTHVHNLENISLGGSVSLWNTTACLTGCFDSLTCVADAWLASPDGGGFGSFNTMYGYFSGGGGPGISALIIERFFYEYLNNGVVNHGIAHSLSLDYFSPPAWCSAEEDVIKGYMLFGDPELPMWTEEPKDLAVQYPSEITGNTAVDVTVTSQGVPLENARVCIQKGDWQTGEIYDVAVTDASGFARLWAAPETTDPFSITIWAHNHNLFSGEIDVLATGIEEVQQSYITAIESVTPVPVSNTASISWSSSGEEPATIRVFDLQGRLVETLVKDSPLSGTQTTEWELNGSISSGVYFIRLNSGSSNDSRQVVVLR